MNAIRTEAGKALLRVFGGTQTPTLIAAIEAEARSELLRSLREQVEALPHWGWESNGEWEVSRAEVLALLEDTETAE